MIEDQNDHLPEEDLKKARALLKAIKCHYQFFKTDPIDLIAKQWAAKLGSYYLNYWDQALTAYIRSGAQYPPSSGAIMKCAIEVSDHDRLSVPLSDDEEDAIFESYVPPTPPSEAEMREEEKDRIEKMRALQDQFDEAKRYRTQKGLPDHFLRPPLPEEQTADNQKTQSLE